MIFGFQLNWKSNQILCKIIVLILLFKFFQINKNSKKNFPSRAFYSYLPSGRIHKNLIQKYTVGILTLCLRKKSLIKFGISFDPRFSIIGDMVFVLKLSELGNCFASQNCLACYRTHHGNLSKKRFFCKLMKCGFGFMS